MGTNVEMNDPRWQSLREAARRLLREDNCTLVVPSENIESAWEVVQLISDYVPSKLGLPKVIEGELSVIGLAKLVATSHLWTSVGYRIVAGQISMNR